MAQPLDLVANRALSPLLKAQAFRKQSRTWRRRASADPAIQVVNLQGSMFSTHAQGRCALNVGIYFPTLAELLGIGALTESPAEADCHLRQRAAMLRPDARDAWFEFDSDDSASIDRAAAAIAELYSSYGEPWLHRLTSLAAARDEFARTRSHWRAAAASLAIGDLTSATSLMRLAVEESPPDIATHLTQWGQHHALL
jgi:hypothetical protein